MQDRRKRKSTRRIDNETELDFTDLPLKDAIGFIKDKHGIEIQLDDKALTDQAIPTDTPVTINVKGITLRSALRLMLRKLQLTYIVRDEVLLITTQTEADNKLVVKVYPVADLVLPINAGGGINPFALGGLGGGAGGGLGGGGLGGGLGGGGLGGGGGFGGGGFGGGGLGGGGFGGAFNVLDEEGETAPADVRVTNAVTKEPAQKSNTDRRPLAARFSAACGKTGRQRFPSRVESACRHKHRCSLGRLLQNAGPAFGNRRVDQAGRSFLSCSSGQCRHSRRSPAFDERSEVPGRRLDDSVGASLRLCTAVDV